VIGFPKPKRIKDRALLDAKKQLPCAACGTRRNVDPHHIRSKGSGGDDTDMNIIPLCRRDHSDWEQIGVVKMVAKYPTVGVWLERNGMWDVYVKAVERMRR
jgi:hypothetical protein